MDEVTLLKWLLESPCTLEVLAERSGLSSEQVRSLLRSLEDRGMKLRMSPDRHWLVETPLDLHEPARIRSLLTAPALSLLSSLEVHWRVDSTNTALLASPSVKDAQQGMRVLLAETQSAGRGRRGKSWASPFATHLYLSVECPFPRGMASMAGLSLVAGVALSCVLEDMGVPDIGVKWPNDLVTPSGKLGGILIESRGAMSGPAHAVIGIGVNVHAALVPQVEIDQPWIYMDRLLKKPCRRDVLVARVLNALLPLVERFRHTGLEPFLMDYQRHDVLRDQPIWVDEGGQRVAAVARGIAADGRLRIQDGQGERLLHAGDVSVRKQ